MSDKTIRIFSDIKIQVMRDLAYRDDTPDMAKAGTVVGSGNFIRVQTLKPISYNFVKGENIIPEKITFIDPLTRKEVSESILTWPGVKHLIANGTFKAFTADAMITGEEKPGTEEKVEKKRKALSDLAE